MLDSKKAESFLKEEEVNEKRRFYEHLTLGILPVGDPMLRRLTYQDQAVVAGVYESADIALSMKSLTEIISATSESQHTTLGKVMATIAYFDLITQHGKWNSQTVQEVTGIILEPQRNPTEKYILAGAFFGRMASQAAQTSDITALKEMYRNLSKNISTRHEQEALCAIEGARNAIWKLIDEGLLRMTFPIATIHDQESSSGRESLGGGFPDTIMYLGRTTAIYYTPSWKKLEEAAKYGAPNAQKHVNESRALRILIGVELEERQLVDNFENSKIFRNKKNASYSFERFEKTRR